MVRIAVFLTLLMCTDALTLVNKEEGVTPMQKVIKLLNGLQAEVAAEGKKEATTYATFACFCRDETKKVSKSITDGNDKIKQLAADYGVQSSKKDAELADNAKRNVKGEASATTLATDTSTCKSDEAKYEASAADQNTAISSLKSAVKSMNTAKPASLIQLRSVMTMDSVRDMVMQKTGVDPKSSEFAYHSNDIVDLCVSLLTDFKTKKATLDSDWQKRSASCTTLKASTNNQIDVNKKEISKNVQETQVINQKLAKDKKDLTEAQSKLNDDALLLKDLTASCESRAKDWDQRSKARAGELKALGAAVSALTGGASAADAAVNKRAALLTVKRQQTESKKGDADGDDSVADESDGSSEDSFFGKDASVSDDAETDKDDESSADHDEVDQADKAPSLLQTIIERGLSPERRAHRSLAALQVKARKMGSLALSALTVNVQGRPFKKIKDLMTKLMQRLLEESEAEATKKGFCDQKLGSLKISIEDQTEDLDSVSAKIGALETDKDELTTSIAKLTKQLTENTDAQAKANLARKTQKDENTQALATARAGLAATKVATNVLRKYYSEAAKAASFVQASPLDGKTGSNAGFEGSYKGAQGSMDAVIGFLETIQSDFDRTIRDTEVAETAAARSHVELSSGLKVDAAGKSSGKELDTEDLATTKTELTDQYANLKGTQALLDNSFKNKVNLVPTCIDTGMSYKDRVAKRQAEITALEQALVDLAPKAL